MNFQGIGLPHYEYSRVVSLLLRAGFVNQFTNEPELSCSEKGQSICQLASPCSTYEKQFDELVFVFNFDAN
jgi:hypothetical protein